jgi:ribonucleoside-diphosphate reductase alpha chain
MEPSTLDSPAAESTATRISLTPGFDIAGYRGSLTVGLFPDGRPGEIFIQISKKGTTTIGGLMDTVATPPSRSNTGCRSRNW